jgi:hypothetical protein
VPQFIPSFNLSKINVDDFYPNMSKKFPFSTIFAGTSLRIVSPNQDDVSLAVASVEKLRPFIDSSIDLETNADLIGVVFNAFVVNRANKNDQVIGTDEALACVENFKYKALNIEHNRKNVVGLITGHGFSRFGTDEPLTEEEVKGMTDPFNVFLTGFVWKTVNKEFAQALEESSDPTSDKYLSISTSWEMGFSKFKAVAGSKNLNECQDIEFENLDEAKACLRHFGGTGVNASGQKIYLQMVGEILPLGVGFVSNPAADVKGVAVAGTETNNEEESKGSSKEGDELENIETGEGKISLNEENSEKNLNLNQKIENKISQTEKTPVIEFTEQQKTLAMLIKNIKDINDENLKEVKASDVTEFLESEIKKASEQWSEQKKKEEEAAAALKQEAESLKAELEKASNELKEIKAAAEARARDEAFQTRMSSLDEEYELADEDRQVIGSQIKDLDDEAFSKWAESFKVIAKEKSKAYKAFLKKGEEKKEEKPEDKKDEKKEEGKASDEDKQKEAEKILEDAKASADNNIPNNGTDTAKPTIFEKWKSAFNKDTVKVQLSK